MKKENLRFFNLPAGRYTLHAWHEEGIQEGGFKPAPTRSRFQRNEDDYFDELCFRTLYNDLLHIS